ncbi:Cyclin N-terminal [Trinorchestia longiramus]|nr:Cyclin N-terminal [Trinorchestia longiramus]
MSLDSPRCELDFSILDHDKTIANLLELQEKHLIRDNKCKLEPACRKLVATWMLEVCEEQSCEDQVFVVAVSIMDRFLNTVSVRKTQLQLLAAVCLLLSSKLRQSHFLSVDLLAYYTDNSITREEITQWELLVVAKLGWDVNAVTAVDFVDSLLRQLAVTGDNIIRRHTLTFVALSATVLLNVFDPLTFPPPHSSPTPPPAPSCGGVGVRLSSKAGTPVGVGAITPIPPSLFLFKLTRTLQTSLEPKLIAKRKCRKINLPFLSNVPSHTCHVPAAYPPVYPPVYPPEYPPVYPSVYPPMYPPVYLPVYQPVYLPVYPPVYPLLMALIYLQFT